MAYGRDQAGRTRMMMLKAAVAIARGGPEKARDQGRGGQPDRVRATETGFELLSPITDRDKQVKLTVGGKAKG